MKKLIAVVLCVGAALFAEARGCGPCGPGGWGCRPCPPPPPGGWHGGWGRGGCNFWPSFAGAAAGTILGNIVSAPRTTYVATPVVTTPVVQPVITTPVVTTPVVTTPVTTTVYTRPAYTSETIIGTPNTVTTVVTQPARTWIPGTYVNQVQANGTTVRVWVEGHYQ